MLNQSIVLFHLHGYVKSAAILPCRPDLFSGAGPYCFQCKRPRLVWHTFNTKVIPGFIKFFKTILCLRLDRHLNQFTHDNPELSWGVKSNFSIESVPDRFFPGTGAYTGSDKALRRKIGLARETNC